MISKQLGFIDPWSLGFLIGLAGLAIAQPWDRESSDHISVSNNETELMVVNDIEGSEL